MSFKCTHQEYVFFLTTVNPSHGSDCLYLFVVLDGHDVNCFVKSRTSSMLRTCNARSANKRVLSPLNHGGFCARVCAASLHPQGGGEHAEDAAVPPRHPARRRAPSSYGKPTAQTPFFASFTPRYAYGIVKRACKTPNTHFLPPHRNPSGAYPASWSRHTLKAPATQAP